MRKGYTTQRLQVRKSSVVIYPLTVGKDNSQSNSRYNLQEKEKGKTYSGQVTAHTKKRIRRAVDILSQLSTWQQIYNPITMKEDSIRLTFITLTIPLQTEKPTGKWAYANLLKPFLQTMIRVHSMNTYIWKCELTKKGMVHYHITTNRFIRYDLIKKRWNELLRKHGLLENYFKKLGHYDANSIDVHKVYNDTQIEAYLEKYISKVNDKDLSVIGKVWDCSKNIRGAKYFTTDFQPHHIARIDKAFIEGECRYKAEDYFTWIKFNKDAPSHILHGYEHILYNEWKQQIVI